MAKKVRYCVKKNKFKIVLLKYMKKKNIIILLLISIPLFSFGTIFCYKIVRWRMYIWLPSYIKQIVQVDESVNGIKHIIFLLVDHYEPGLGEKGVLVNREWLDAYKKLARRHRDSYGRMPQHTWFYAYDHKNELIMPDLARAVREGYGEVEFHWHHKLVPRTKRCVKTA